MYTNITNKHPACMYTHAYMYVSQIHINVVSQSHAHIYTVITFTIT